MEGEIMNRHSWINLLIGTGSIGAIELIHQLPLNIINLPHLDADTRGFISDVLKWGLQIVMSYYTVKNLKKKN